MKRLCGFNFELFYNMELRDILKRLIFIFRNKSLKPVKHFAAAALCASHFQSWPRYDEANFQKTWYSMVRKYGKWGNKKVEVTLYNGEKIWVKVPPQVWRQGDIRKNMDIAFMGTMAKIFDLKWNPSKQKMVWEKNPQHFHEQRERQKEILQKAPQALEPGFQAEVNRNLLIEDFAPGIKLVSYRNTYPAVDGNNDLATAIKFHFLTLYMQMANWAYREAGLERNKGLSSATMIDEIAKLINEGQGLHYYLLFDQKVLEARLQMLQSMVPDFEKAQTLEEKKKVLGDISDPAQALFPFAGVAAAIPFLQTGQPVELKRYFKNLVEDPFDLVSGKFRKDEYILRHKMLYRAVADLAPQTLVEVHAHRDEQADRYTKLGFQKKGIIENPLYQGVKVHLLQASREEVLKALQVILDKNR